MPARNEHDGGTPKVQHREPGRRPDYKLSALNKRTDERNPHCGAGWANADGSISIRLDYLVTIQHSTDLVLTLFPNDEGPRSAG